MNDIKEIQLNYQPHPTQLKIFHAIEDKIAKYFIAANGRQAGKSLTCQTVAIKWAAENPGVLIGCITPAVKQYRRIFDGILNTCKDTILIKDSFASTGNFKIVFFNDSIIEFYNTQKDENSPIRGATFDYLIVDEAAYIKDKTWDEVISATFAVKGKQALIVSTPKKKNWFYNLFMEGQKNNKTFWSIKVPSTANPFFPIEDYELKRKILPEAAFQQEYEAEFLDNGGEVFININQLFSLPGFAQPTEKVYVGIDIGFKVDFTVITILNERGELVSFDRFNNPDTRIVIEDIKRVLRKHKNIAGYIEENNSGIVVFDQIKDEFQNIDATYTLNQNKSEMIQQLRLAITDCKIKSPKIVELEHELEIFEFDVSPSGRLIYAAPDGMHDDCVMSLAFAYKALQNKSMTYGIQIVFPTKLEVPFQRQEKGAEFFM